MFRGPESTFRFIGNDFGDRSYVDIELSHQRTHIHILNLGYHVLDLWLFIIIINEVEVKRVRVGKQPEQVAVQSAAVSLPSVKL